MSYYYEILSSYINESGKTLKDISRELFEEKNIAVDSSYISKIKSGKKPPASEEVNRALAEVLNGNPNELVFAGYLEKAPSDVQNAFFEIDRMVNELIKNLIMNSTISQLAVIIDHLRQFNIDNTRPFRALDQINFNEIGRNSREILTETLEGVLQKEFSQREKLKMIPFLFMVFQKLQKERISLGMSHHEHEQKQDEEESREYQNELFDTAENLSLSLILHNGETEIITPAEGEYLKKCLAALRSYNNVEGG
jgi:transcriptional regulator with XRE-family HTH domain